MKLSNNTILITGGSSGIGFEMAKSLVGRKNKVLICGRTKSKLEKAKEQIPQLEIFQCDLGDKNGCVDLAKWIKTNHNSLNILINNAAITHNNTFLEDNQSVEKAEKEMQINFHAPLRLIKYLNPLLEKNKDSAIVNITTGLVYVPRAEYSIYNSTKSALHSFTQVLRLQMNKSNTRVIEILYPVVDTPWHKKEPPAIAISPQKAVREAIQGLEKGKSEIKVGAVKKLHLLYRLAPRFALKKINSL